MGSRPRTKSPGLGHLETYTNGVSDPATLPSLFSGVWTPLGKGVFVSNEIDFRREPEGRSGTVSMNESSDHAHHPERGRAMASDLNVDRRPSGTRRATNHNAAGACKSASLATFVRIGRRVRDKAKDSVKPGGTCGGTLDYLLVLRGARCCIFACRRQRHETPHVYWCFRSPALRCASVHAWLETRQTGF